MRNLLLFLLRYSSLLTFIALEAIALFLIIRYNQGQRDIFFYSSNIFSGKLYDQVDRAKNYFRLTEINDSLALENARLISQLYSQRDTGINGEEATAFNITPVRVINNSVNKRNNTITIAKGAVDGVRRSMGLIGKKGIVGIVRHVGNKYAVALSILNTDVSISAKIKRSNFFGTLKWDGKDGRYMYLHSIPKHAEVRVNDTIATTGYSTIFPGNIDIGRVDEIDLDHGKNEYTLKIKLINSLYSLDYAYLVDIKEFSDVKELEALIEDE